MKGVSVAGEFIILERAVGVDDAIGCVNCGCSAGSVVTLIGLLHAETRMTSKETVMNDFDMVSLPFVLFARVAIK